MRFRLTKKNVPFFHAAKISIPFEPFTFLSAFLSIRYGNEDKIAASRYKSEQILNA